MAYRLAENCSATHYRASAPKARTGDAYRRLNAQIMNPLLSAEPSIDRRSEVGFFNKPSLPLGGKTVTAVRMLTTLTLSTR
jgi:hypothetical protein